MQRSKSLAMMFLLGAALVGGVLGFTADRMLVRDQLCPKIGGQQAMRDRIAAELGLDAAQRARFDSILIARNTRIDSLQLPIRPQMDSLIQAARAEIRTMLTPEQQARYDDLKREIDRNRAERR
jgi:hypothetical protein